MSDDNRKLVCDLSRGFIGADGWVSERIGKEFDNRDTHITELERLLKERDGGAHDADCNANYGRQCTCGHDAVTKYFEEVEE